MSGAPPRDASRRLATDALLEALPIGVIVLNVDGTVRHAERRHAMNLALWLHRQARLAPDRPAVAGGTALRYTHAQLARAAAEGAAWLASQGLGPGERVGIFRTNCPEYIAQLWSAWWAGTVAVPMNERLHGREAAYILAHAGARLCLADAAHAAALEPHLPADCRLVTDDAPWQPAAATGTPTSAAPLTDASPPTNAAPPTSAPPPADIAPPAPRAWADPAWLFYTSGTTGRPKGVTLTHQNLLHMALAYTNAVQPVGPGETCLHPAPLSHGSGLYHLPYVMNGGLNVVPASGGLDCAEVFALAAHWKRASMFAAPTIVNRLAAHARAHGLDGRDFSRIVYGGAPMYLADVLAAREALGPVLAQIYGQGESPMTITVLPGHVIADRAHPRWRQRLGSVGYAHPMLELSVRAPGGAELPAGTPGEVCVRGDVVMAGYWNDPAATAAAIRDGWLHTGDIGMLDEDGFLTLLDRSKDLVISGGNNIYPREVEEALLLHPGVREVAVIGRPDPQWGESLVAYVVAAAPDAAGGRDAGGVGGAGGAGAVGGPPVDAAALEAHCLAHIARYKRPKVWRFVEALPKNNYGKVLKTALREMEAKSPITGEAPSAG